MPRDRWPDQSREPHCPYDCRIVVSDPPARVFIGSSVEGRPVAEQLQAALDEFTEPNMWDQRVFVLSQDTLGGLIGASQAHDFAILVLTADDVQSSRGETDLVARDNVIFELGLFFGALGRDRVIVVQPRKDMRMPSDLAGVTTCQYNGNRADGNLRAAINPAAVQIREHITRVGTRGREFGGESTSVVLSSRTDLLRHVPEPRRRMLDAEQLILISGIDNKQVVESESWALEDALRRGVKVRILCLDPTAAPFVANLTHLDRFGTAEAFQRSIAAVEAQLTDLQAVGDLEYKFLPYTPAIHFFVTDPDSTGGTFKIEAYTPLGSKPGLGRPHFVLGPQSRSWRSQLLQIWAHYWDTARNPDAYVRDPQV